MILNQNHHFANKVRIIFKMILNQNHFKNDCRMQCFIFLQHGHSYWFAFNINSFSDVLSLSLFRRNVPMSPAQLNSRSIAVDNRCQMSLQCRYEMLAYWSQIDFNLFLHFKIIKIT